MSSLQPVQCRVVLLEIGPKITLPTSVDSLEPRGDLDNDATAQKVVVDEAIDTEAGELGDELAKLDKGICSQSSSHTRHES